MSGYAVAVGGCGLSLCFTLPRPVRDGETMVATGLTYVTGGKAANHAVGLSALGVTSYLLSAVGDDAFGADARHRWESRGVRSDAVHTIPDATTMIGCLQVADTGQNNIVLHPGALTELSVDLVDRHQALVADAACVVVSLEIPVAPALQALRIARRHGVLTVLNPSPAPTPSAWASLAPEVDLVVVNASEAEALTGSCRADDWAPGLRAMGVREVLLTQGEAGATLVSPTQTLTTPGVPVEATDTSGAGDGFLSAYLAARLNGAAPSECLSFAAEAAAEIVQGPGFVEALGRWDVAELAQRLPSPGT